jgi:hypothetical protein
MKQLLFLALFVAFSSVWAQENTNPYDVQVSSKGVNGRIHIEASYVVPINVCNAFAFITSYENAKNIPGILESKVISRAGNKVRVYRVIEEQILFFQIELKSTIEYTEEPNRLISFEQIGGDTKLYKGSWRLSPNKDSTVFKYDAIVEPHPLIPLGVIEYFMKNNLKERFEFMAQRARDHKVASTTSCK